MGKEPSAVKKKLKLANPGEELKSPWPTSEKADLGSKKTEVPRLRRTFQKK